MPARDLRRDRRPHSVAVTDGTRSLTYLELDRAANRLAHRLRAHGATPDGLVGLCAERTVDLVVGVLAILKSGAGHLPLDPRHPAARLRDTLADAECRILLGDTTSCAPLLDGEAPAFIPLTTDGGAGPDDHAPAPHPGAGPDTTAYVIYTSGSTGRPKGVVVTHANVTRLFTATEQDFGFGADDVWTLFHSLAFDFSVWELWGPLLHGGRLVVVPYLTSRDPHAFLELLRTERVTVLNQTPTAFRQLAAAAEDADHPDLALRTVVFGGEALDPASLAGWVGGYGLRRPRLVNMYGITETTVHVTVRPLALADLSGSLSPIGRPLSDLRVHVLDADMNEVPDGTEGEMYVGGPGVARGYLNRPQLTEERFVPDPFGAPGERLYRSGDLAVRRADGELEYRGRIDHQVKLNGFRIELGEIERALLDQPGVRAAACVLREDTPGLPRLVGYVVPAPGHEDPQPAQLREALSVRLPAHMLPAAVIPLAELPLTGNGKLDRDRLPTPEAHHATSARPRATEPRTPAEHTLAAVWRHVLDVPGPGVDDNFFALGGDSLRAVRVAALAREAGLPVSVEQIFLHPSVAALAAAAGTPDETAAPAPAACSTTLADLDPSQLPAGTIDAYPTAAMQLGILYECEFAEDETPGLYHDLISLRLDGPFDRPALERALATLTERHAVLRTAFRLGTFREPMQLVAETARVPLSVEEHDTGRPDAKTHEHLLRTWWEREKQDPFDTEQAPLARCHVLRTDPDGFQLSLAVHHAILDGWSLALLTTELLLAYEGELRPDATGPALPPAPGARYRDFVAAEQRAQADPAARAWWERLLRQEGEPAELPLDPDGEAEDEFAFHTPLPEELDTALDEAAARLGLPVKSLFLAAHARALAELTSSERTVTAVQVNGRLEEPGADRVLGLLLNMIPLHLTARGTWAELAGAAFDAERARQPHRRYPLAALQQLTGCGTALFNVAFNYTDFHTFDDLAALRAIRPATGGSPTGTASRSWSRSPGPRTPAAAPSPSPSAPTARTRGPGPAWAASSCRPCTPWPRTRTRRSPPRTGSPGDEPSHAVPRSGPPEAAASSPGRAPARRLPARGRKPVLLPRLERGGRPGHRGVARAVRGAGAAHRRTSPTGCPGRRRRGERRPAGHRHPGRQPSARPVRPQHGRDHRLRDGTGPHGHRAVRPVRLQPQGPRHRRPTARPGPHPHRRGNPLPPARPRQHPHVPLRQPGDPRPVPARAPRRLPPGRHLRPRPRQPHAAPPRHRAVGHRRPHGRRTADDPLARHHHGPLPPPPLRRRPLLPRGPPRQRPEAGEGAAGS
ncbi:amino acid adenylation domain-containing protein [Streptomyces sp. S399]|nr:amino acid adenylation domain-containing protein [Streptomyces sp. S399]WPR54583.1 amino acid adenylation domain-containing protein [Streptomyces sp. S399]